MKTPFLQILIIICAVACSLGAQASVEPVLDTRARVDTGSGRIKLSKSPNGQVAITSIRSYICPALGQDWAELNPSGGDNTLITGLEDNACWAGDDILVTGDDKGINVYAKTDGGKFKIITSGQGEYVDAIYGNGTGKIWVSSFDFMLSYSEDCGKTWVKKQLYDKIDDNDIKNGGYKDVMKRVVDMYFLKDDATGIFGTAWNLLYITHDNCKTYQRILTPLDQGVNVLRNKYQQPSFAKVRIFGDFYIVSQNGKTYITERDDINWEAMKGVSDFDVTDNGYLVLLLKNGAIRFLDQKLAVKAENKIPAHFSTLSIQAMGDKCYAVNTNSLYEVSVDGEARLIDMYSTAAINVLNEVYLEPTSVVVDGQKYYFNHQDVITRDKTTNQWYRHMSLGMNINGCMVDANGMPVVYDNNENLYSVDIKNKVVKPYLWPDRLFAHKKVTKVKFFVSSRGCGHYYYKSVNFKLKGDKFVWEKDSVSDNNVFKSFVIPHESIVANDVQYLVRLIEQSRTHTIAPSDTIITAQDMNEYKSLVEVKVKTEEINESLREAYLSFDCVPDFDWWQTLTDIIIEQPDNGWSTKTETMGMIFVFADGSEMMCENSNYKHNYSFVPWSVVIDNDKDNKNDVLLVYKSFCFEIGHVMDKLASGALIPKPYNSKAQALFQIAEYDLNN